MTRIVVLAWAVLGAVPVGGFHAEGPEWTIDASLVAGERAAGTLQIDVRSRAGFHINDEYPLNFRPGLSDGVQFSRARFDRGDGMTFQACAGEAGRTCSVRIAAGFVRQGAGPAVLNGTVAFSACSEERCIIQKVDVTLHAPP
jgi:hypothetical protein